MEQLFGNNAMSRLGSMLTASEFGLSETELLELLMPTSGQYSSVLNLNEGLFNFSSMCTAKRKMSKSDITKTISLRNKVM